jgi:hypothetical protein
MKRVPLTICLGILLALTPAWAMAQHAGHSPYAGQEGRAIKSLSDEDVEELRRGGGWGLALVAELNGVPGPVHLLELKDEIPLRADQVAAIEAIYVDMKAEAVPVGERLIAGETALEAVFATNDVGPERLRALIQEIEAARAELRFIHLSRHLSTPALLDAAQIARYKELRGYREDPCANVPEGHDAGMWRRHNNCS